MSAVSPEWPTEPGWYWVRDGDRELEVGRVIGAGPKGETMLHGIGSAFAYKSEWPNLRWLERIPEPTAADAEALNEPRPLTREELAAIRGYAKDTSESGASTAALLLLAHDFWKDEAKAAQRDYCQLEAATPGTIGSARDVARKLGWDDLDWETHGE